jgi:hypothetical protein
MRTRHLSRRLVGLLAAYLVALPALILPLAMPAAAASISLCATEHGTPSGHDPACPCAAVCGMQCPAPALAAGEAAPLPAPQWRVVAVVRPAPLVAVSAQAVRRPQLPRGPPEA